MNSHKWSSVFIVAVILTAISANYSCCLNNESKTNNETEIITSSDEVKDINDGVVIYKGENECRSYEFVIEKNGAVHIIYKMVNPLDTRNRNLAIYEIINDSTRKTSTLNSEGHYSLALDNDGNAHVAHRGKIHPSYATYNNGKWTDVVISDEYGCSGTSIVVDGTGTPHIAYYNSADMDLMYASPSNGVWESITVDSEGKVGEPCSLVVGVDGVVHIAYFANRNPNTWDSDFGSFELIYAKKSNGEWQIDTIDTGILESVSGVIDIELDDKGQVHIVYGYFKEDDSLGYGIRYVYWDGSTWQTQDAVDEPTSYRVDLTMDGNKPIIAYFKDSLHIANFDGNKWNTFKTIDEMEYSNDCKISSDPDGVIHLVFSGRTELETTIRYIKY